MPLLPYTTEWIRTQPFDPAEAGSDFMPPHQSHAARIVCRNATVDPEHERSLVVALDAKDRGFPASLDRIGKLWVRALLETIIEAYEAGRFVPGRYPVDFPYWYRVERHAAVLFDWDDSATELSDPADLRAFCENAACETIRNDDPLFLTQCNIGPNHVHKALLFDFHAEWAAEPNRLRWPGILDGMLLERLRADFRRDGFLKVFAPELAGAFDKR